MASEVALEIMRQVIANLIGSTPKSFSQNIDSLYHKNTTATYDAKSKQWMASSGSSLDFQSYFNAFYGRNIKPLNKKIEQATLFLAGEGLCSVTIFQKSLSKTIQIVVSDVSLSPEGTHIPFVIDSDSVYWPVIDFKADSRLSAVQWYVEVSEVAQVSFAVISTTFKKEKDIIATISALDSYFKVSDEQVAFIVVDNGQTLGSDDFPAGTLLFKQENLGGAGGFTRGVREAYGRNYSHYLFMDDDIELDPEVVWRTIQLQKLNQEGVMLAGSMLDRMKPEFHFECGAKVRLESLGIDPKLYGIDLANPKDYFDKFQALGAIDYGAWWYFSFSKNNYEKIGDPLQIFIRGDDIEFGLRGKKNNIITIPLGGIGVWHEPFYAKNNAWIRYYIVRNMLLLHSKYCKPKPGPYILKLVFKDFIGAILRFEYDAAVAILLGLKDYLRIDEVLSESPEENHIHLLGVLRPYLPAFVDSDPIAIPKDRSKPSAWFLAWKLLSLNFTLGERGFQVLSLDQYSWTYIRKSEVRVLEPAATKLKVYRNKFLINLRLVFEFFMALPMFEIFAELVLKGWGILNQKTRKR